MSQSLYSNVTMDNKYLFFLRYSGEIQKMIPNFACFIKKYPQYRNYFSTNYQFYGDYCHKNFLTIYSFPKVKNYKVFTNDIYRSFP